jgi:cyclopropane fatty-acyl-phospholipid synthase-like methyltransferase
VFTTIFVTPDLDPRSRRAAQRAGPVHVSSRRSYPDLIAQAGFVDTTEVDLTPEYRKTQQDWCEATEQRAEELRSLMSEAELAEAQGARRVALEAIDAGFLRRSLFVATRP